MKVKTTRFGELEVNPTDLVTFAEGLFGFENLKKYFVVDPGDSTLILWLQSTEEEKVANFFAKEYSTTLSINQEGVLLIKGRFGDIIVGSTLKKYIKNFLQCVACKTINTSVERKTNKLTYLVCHNDKCKSEKVIKYNL